MKTTPQTSVQCVSSAAASKPGDQLLSNVYASRRGRSPSDPKGMANADIVMQRLENGLPLKQALMPGASYEGYHSHCKLFPKWAEKARALVARNAEAGKMRKLEKMGVLRRRGQTHCKRGHPFTPENTRVKRPEQTWTMGRQCKICALEKEQFRGPLLKPEVRAEVVRALKRRATYAEIRVIVKDMGAFYRTRRRDPEFDALCLEWSSGSRERMARRSRARNGRKQYDWVASFIPGYVAADDRPEIVSMVVEAHKRRTFRRKPFGITKTPQRMKEFVSEFNKQNPTKAYGGVDSPWSLDAPLTHDSNTRLIETVSEGLW